MHKIYKIILICFILLSSVSIAHAQVRIKFIVANPSPDESKKTPIEFRLPKEVKKEHVLDSGGLTIQYNVEDGFYYLAGDVELQPKESKVFQIEVEDLWSISEEKLDFVELQAQESLKALQESPQYQVGKALTDNIIERINAVKQDQAQEKSISDRVKSYYVNIKKLDTIENDILVLEGLVSESQQAQEPRVVSIKIQLKNPSSIETIEKPVQYYLPPEVNIIDIEDNAGFDIRYDNKRLQIYLEKTITFEPDETKEYIVRVKDVWFINKAEIDLLEAESAKVVNQLLDTAMAGLAQMLDSRINEIIQAVKESEALDLTLQERVRLYRENKEKMEVAKQYLERLKTLLLQFEIAKGGEAGEKEKIHKKDITFGGGKAEGKGGGVGKGLGTALGQARGQTTQEAGGGMQAIRGLKGLIIISESIFRGWKPDIVTTWIIILSILGFLGIFSALFYTIWWIKSSKEKARKQLAK